MKTACPTCTTSAKTNIANHLKCIEVASLGPADPREPSTEFWADKAKKWNVEEGEARARLCLNCEHYIATSAMKDCIANGEGGKVKASALPVEPKWADIQGMPTAVCSLYNITCSALRTCDDWEEGGPITDDSETEDSDMEETKFEMSEKPKKKGRCWKGCKPVPGKKPYSKGSCSCGMSALAPGMIEFGPRMDKAWQSVLNATGARDAEEASGLISRIEHGYSGATNSWDMQRLRKLMRGRARKLATTSGIAAGAGMGIAGYLAGRSRKKEMSSLTPGMVAFALGEDNRPRNGNGQFVANETGGADPNSMQAAYGGVEQEKMARRQGLMARLKAMMGGK